MIIDFNRTVAYVCPGCGDVAYGKFSLFELSGGRSISVSCDCGKSSLKISYKNDKIYSITVGCQVCEKEHEYAVPLTELLHQQLLEFSCPELLMGLIFVGDDGSEFRNSRCLDSINNAGLLFSKDVASTIIATPSTEATIHIKQNFPLPLTILSTSVTIEVQDPENS